MLVITFVSLLVLISSVTYSAFTSRNGIYPLNALAYSDLEPVQIILPELKISVGIFEEQLAQIQEDLKNETQNLDKYILQYENEQISKDQMLSIIDNHIISMQNILPRYDQLNTPQLFTPSVKLFKLSTQAQLDSDKLLKEWIMTGDNSTKVRSDQLLEQAFNYETNALQSYENAKSTLSQNAVSTLSQNTSVIPIGLHKGEWVKYKVVYYVPKISQGMKELAKSLSTSPIQDKNLTTSKFFSSKIVIKDVLNDSYVYDGVVYNEDGTITNTTNIIGDFEPNDHYMLVVPVNLQVGDTVKGMTLLHDGIVKDVFSKPILGQNIDVFEIVENNKTSSENYTAESHTDSFYDKKTGILLQSSTSISTSGSEFGSNIVGYEISATEFSDLLSPNSQATVPEFPSISIVLMIATFAIVLIPRMRHTF